MSYEPTTWKSGDTVTSAKLNKMEQGIANAGALVVTDTNGTLDHTFQEIYDAAPLVALYALPTGYNWLLDAAEDGGMYGVVFDKAVYLASSADGYPSKQT